MPDAVSPCPRCKLNIRVLPCPFCRYGTEDASPSIARLMLFVGCVAGVLALVLFTVT